MAARRDGQGPKRAVPHPARPAGEISPYLPISPHNPPYLHIQHVVQVTWSRDAAAIADIAPRLEPRCTAETQSRGSRDAVERLSRATQPRFKDRRVRVYCRWSAARGAEERRARRRWRRPRSQTQCASLDWRRDSSSRESLLNKAPSYACTEHLGPQTVVLSPDPCLSCPLYSAPSPHSPGALARGAHASIFLGISWFDRSSPWPRQPSPPWPQAKTAPSAVRARLW